MKKIIIQIFIVLSLVFSLPFAGAEIPEEYNADLDYAQVLFVRIVNRGADLWDFQVTVRHNDEGWDHYADAWEIIDPETGSILGMRTLLHPHDSEQPFTRSKQGVEIPSRINKVVVRAKCNVHAFEGKRVTVDFSVLETDSYQIVKK